MSTQSAASWARTTQFHTPIRLGDIEAEVLSRPIDSVPQPSQPGTRWLTAVLALLVVGAPPLVGLVALWFASPAGGADATALDISRAAYLIAAVMPLGILVLWGLVYGRHRTAVELPLAGLSTVCALVGILLGAGSGLEMPGNLQFRMILAAITGGVSFLVVLVASKPGPPPLMSAGAEAATDEERVRLRDRTLVAHVLRDRGLIDSDTYGRAVKMPLGSWHELDAPHER